MILNTCRYLSQKWITLIYHIHTHTDRCLMILICLVSSLFRYYKKKKFKTNIHTPNNYRPCMVYNNNHGWLPSSSSSCVYGNGGGDGGGSIGSGGGKISFEILLNSFINHYYYQNKRIFFLFF